MVRYGSKFEGRPAVVYGSSLEKLEAARKEMIEDTSVKLPESTVMMIAEQGEQYRERCRFSMVGKFGGVGPEALNYSMFDGQNEEAVSRGFHLGTERLNRLMRLVLVQLREYEALGGNGLRAVHFHAPRREESAALVTLVYGSQIADVDMWYNSAVRVRAAFGDTKIHLIGRCKGQILVYEARSTFEELIVADERFLLEFPEGSFCHPNTGANERSVAWLRKQFFAFDSPPRMLELFCGAGNHTTCLAKLCTALTIVEVDDQLVQAAKRNLKRNDLDDNVTFITSDAFKFCKRLLRRARHQRKEDFDFDIILVDPPRRGLDSNTLELLKLFPHVLYVSCNPVALRADISQLADSHTIHDFAFLDAFPSTPHLECLAHFVHHDSSSKV